MNQYLLNPDGSMPAGANVEALEAAGVLFVIPTPIPAAPEAHRPVEAPPEQVDGKWYQRWNFEPVEPEPEAVPEKVSRFQARAALFEAGLLSTVEALMAAPETPMLMKLAWVDAQEFLRTSPTVLTLSGALGLSEADLDTLFIRASKIVA